MPKPSSIPTWATDPGARVDPGPARNATGFLPSKKLPAKWLNWILAQGGEWFQYLRDLHLEPEFLDKLYVWTGGHNFRGPGPTAIGVFGDLATSGEVTYCDALGYTTPKLRIVQLPMSGLAAEGVEGTSAWQYARVTTDGAERRRWIKVSSVAGRLNAEFQLPDGSKIVNVRACVSPASGPTVIRVGRYQTYIFPVGETFALYAAAAELSVSTESIYELVIPDNQASPYAALSNFVVSFETSALCQVHWIKVTFLDPGPRNY